MFSKINIVAFMLVVLFSGCDKFLDKQPENMVSVDVLFSDLEGTKAALTGIYTSMFETNYYNGARMLYPEITAGNVANISTNRANYLDVYSFTVEAQNSSMNNLYAQLYTSLYSLNNIILNTPKLSDASAREQNELLAQAYGLRALHHFDLVQLFAQPYTYTPNAAHLGIVLATTPIYVSNANISRSTVAQVYAQIEEDLQRAREHFELSQSIFLGSRSQYMNRSAVIALQARVALQKGDWNQAATYSNEVINGDFRLYTNQQYTDAWKNAGGSETILEVAAPSSFAGESLGNFYVPGSSMYQFGVSQDLLRLYSDNDIRKSGAVLKYPTYGTAATSVKIIRLTEMYLIRAEAFAENGEIEKALVDLNTIRSRGDFYASAFTTTSQTALVSEILKERRRELAFEGFYFFDLMRRGLSVERSDCEGLNCNLSYPSDKFVLPLPQQSVNANAKLIQNPGY
ncbi:RagB/SusD family nutrient uptake outer membrane protein [Sphingobacterium oryzagri]|uniref:RagB/SusD family nutrient uptake outer membrane protein n=1 Tax=Sphingobacterium oryzagri TaxID=3025669 RepID=A0ABY7WKM0_9SPHI|nr:RagB/SusD family nutrient uptake outer membrane protein [Sphingobacterium sp. KACC 22765]WDF70055.1 RagB/SusD family nutrient uptake outer membrane protein [Sphingobacterium sp. KACC 22765]